MAPHSSTYDRLFIWILVGHAILLQVMVQTLRINTSYRAIELDMPLVWLGLLATIFHVAPGLVGVYVGRLADRKGEAFCLNWGAVICVGVSAGFLFLADTLTALFVLTAALGIGHSLCLVGEQSLLSKMTTDTNRDAFFGYYTVAISAGQFISPVVISLLTGDALLPPTQLLFAIALGSAVLVLVFGLPLRTPRIAVAQKEAAEYDVISLLRLPGFSLAMISNIIVIVAIDMFLVYLPALGAEKGISVAVIGTLLAIRALSAMSARVFTRYLLSKIDRKRLLVLSIGVAAASTILLTVTDSVFVMGLLMMFTGMGLGLCLPLTLVWTTNITPVHVRGVALSIRLTGNRAGQVAFPALMGVIASVVGLSGVFWFVGGALAATALSVQALVRGRI